MTVIPFDPSRPRSRGGAPPEDEVELARARARLATLERTLIMTLRENARNWARAESAEAEIERLRAAMPPSADAGPAPTLGT